MADVANTVIFGVMTFVTVHSGMLLAVSGWLLISMTLSTPQVWMIVMSICRFEHARRHQKGHQPLTLPDCIVLSLQDGNLFIFVITNSATMLAGMAASVLYGNGPWNSSRTFGIFSAAFAALFMLLATYVWTDTRNKRPEATGTPKREPTTSNNMRVHYLEFGHPVLHMQPMAEPDVKLSVALASLTFILVFVVETVALLNG